MTRSKLARWAAVLALVIAPATASVSAEETDTITITGTFKMHESWGTLGADLAGVFANGGEHPWTATLHGVTHSHASNQSIEVYATSFEFQFSGPDAATLNAAVGDQLGGSGASLLLAWGGAQWQLSLPSADPDAGVYFYAYDDSQLSPPFATDPDGDPVLPFYVVGDSFIVDTRNGNSGNLVSHYDFVVVTGDLGSHPPAPPPVPATLRIADRSAAEGNRGSSKLGLAVSLASTSDHVITVDYRTVAGTALAKSDYTAASGTLTFQPGETMKTITISIKADRKAEGDETFTVELSNAVGTTIDDAVATATIVNDD